MSLLRSFAEFIIWTIVASAYLSAQSVERSIVGPRSINRLTCNPTAIVVTASELLRAKNGKLKKDEKHKQKYIAKGLNGPKESRYKFSHTWVLLNRFKRPNYSESSD